MNMRFVYVLTGWEGSAANSRVLRNAINRENGLKVPKGNYYLCDNDYPNCEGFLTPYKGVRYHLNEWTSRMDCASNHTRHDGDRVKFVRGRRSWSKIEEDALIMCLTNVVIEGWKSENGFKTGFQRELEKVMRKIIPGTDIAVNPHINSKIHVWKKEYGVLSDLLSKSGISWNSTTSMIEVEDEGVLDSCKRWIEIFGKDRATGENVVDPIDIINELYRSGMDQEGDIRERCVPLTPGGILEKDDNLISKSMDPNLNAMSRDKKRKTVDSDISMLVESLGDFMKFSKLH
ncbi:hypothetical protein ACS0TY_015157 [Phlomoides rotata]